MSAQGVYLPEGCLPRVCVCIPACNGTDTPRTDTCENITFTKYIYHLEMEVCKGFVFTGVCLSRGRGHVWSGGMRGWWGMHGRGCAWQGGRVAGACVAGETATAAGGTHPTGMHSCFNLPLRCHRSMNTSPCCHSTHFCHPLETRNRCQAWGCHMIIPNYDIINNNNYHLK